MNTNNYIKTVTEYNKKSYESLKELAGINKNSLEQISEQQVALANLLLESNTKFFETASKAKSYSDVLNIQSELSADFSGKALGIARNTTDILSESKSNVSNWAEKQVKSIPTANPFTKAA